MGNLLSLEIETAGHTNTQMWLVHFWSRPKTLFAYFRQYFCGRRFYKTVGNLLSVVIEIGSRTNNAQFIWFFFGLDLNVVFGLLVLISGNVFAEYVFIRH